MSREHEGEETKIERFRALVQQEFGRNLEKATPANVREFLEQYQQEFLYRNTDGPLELNEPKNTYEEILKDFFLRVLDRPSEEAMILLWLMAFELSFYAIEQHLSEKFQPLFGETPET